MNNMIDSNVISYVNQTSATDKNDKASQDLSSNFMTLLITQLQNQDPLKPLENAELTSQLAQINTVSGIEDLNQTMKAITAQMDASQQLQATALIGRGVLIPGDKILAGNGVTTPFGVEMDQAATKVDVNILNNNGEIVRQFDIGALGVGVESFTWDGKNNQGEAVPDGAYRVQIIASNEENPVLANALNYALVSGVSNTKAGTLLDLGGTAGRVPLTDVRQVI